MATKQKATKEILEGLSKSVKQKKADEVTKAALTKKITDKKDLVYNYPEDCTTLEKRKAFRAMVRKKLKNLEKEFNMVSKGKKEGSIRKIDKEINEVKKEFFNLN